MEKAYDLKDLAKKAQDKGLPVLEDAALELYQAVKEWIMESAIISENKYDDLGIPFVKYVDNIILPQIDKIDGKTDEA